MASYLPMELLKQFYAPRQTSVIPQALGAALSGGGAYLQARQKTEEQDRARRLQELQLSSTLLGSKTPEQLVAGQALMKQHGFGLGPGSQEAMAPLEQQLVNARMRRQAAEDQQRRLQALTAKSAALRSGGAAFKLGPEGDRAMESITEKGVVYGRGYGVPTKRSGMTAAQSDAADRAKRKEIRQVVESREKRHREAVKSHGADSPEAETTAKELALARRGVLDPWKNTIKRFDKTIARMTAANDRITASVESVQKMARKEDLAKHQKIVLKSLNQELTEARRVIRDSRTLAELEVHFAVKLIQKALEKERDIIERIAQVSGMGVDDPRQAVDIARMWGATLDDDGKMVGDAKQAAAEALADRLKLADRELTDQQAILKALEHLK